MTITTNYRKNKGLLKDFNRVIMTATRRSRTVGQRIFYATFGCLGLFSGTALLAIGDEIGGSTLSVALLGLLFGAYFMINAVFFYAVRGFYSARMMPKEIDDVHFTFDEESVTVDNVLERCSHPYGVIQGVYESKRIFVLLVTNRVGYLINKADLTEEENDALREVLRTRMSVPLITYDF